MTGALHSRAVLWLIAATAFWGLSFPFTKALYAGQRAIVPGASSWFLASLDHAARCVVAVACLLPFVVRAGRIRGEEWRQGIALGLSTAGGLLLQADGLDHTLASTSAFLTQFTCALLPLWASVAQRRLPSPRIAGCTALVLVGVAILSGLRPGDLRFGRGEAETLLSTLFFTVQILLLERPRFAANRAVATTTVMFSVVGGVLALFAAVAAPAPSAIWKVWTHPANLALLAALTLCCSIVAFLLMTRWQRHVTATEAGLIYCFEPVFASLCALFFPGMLSGLMGIDYGDEHFTWRLVAGGGLILLANAALQLQPAAAKAEVHDASHG